jgi:hypothetical protein
MADDIEEGLRFTHLMTSAVRADLAENRATLYALLEELSERGAIDLASLEERRERARVLEEERNQVLPRVLLAPKDDKYALKNLPDIDCRALLPICKGRCCRLVFALSEQDIEERVLKWDYGRPYLIQQKDGRCCHQNGDGTCGVYEKRPGPCRTYDCRQDKRIWIDFEKRIPAPE